MADTQIILKENVPGLGAEADIVKVSKGFARNHLIPTGKAYEVTASNLKRLNHLKSQRAEREARELNEAEDFSRKIGKLKLEFTLETGETGKAFGSVTTSALYCPSRKSGNDKCAGDSLRVPSLWELCQSAPFMAEMLCRAGIAH